MKNLFLALIFLCFCTIHSQAQHYSTEFGKIGKDDIELVTYDKDKSAEAVVLFDIGKSHFVDDYNKFNVLFERSKRIKILSEAGIKYAEIEIPYYQEGGIYEEIYELQATTYNFENNQLIKTELQDRNWHDEKINDYWRVRKFAFPNVKSGSIIEFRYKLKSPYVFNLQDWEFQSKIPTVYSQYTAKIIPFYNYSYISQGMTKYDKQQAYVEKGSKRSFASVEYNDMVYEFVMLDVPAFKSEDYISSINDYIMKIDFQLAEIAYPDGQKKEIMTTWPKLIEEYLEHSDFGKYIKKCEKLAPKLIDNAVLSTMTKKEKFEYILKYVKENYSWNGYNAKYASKSASTVIKDKFGNSAELNLLAIGLLRATGIETEPVLISTRDHGQIRQSYPFNHFFNYVLIFAELDGVNTIADATEKSVGFYRIPSRCINDRGLLVKEAKKEKWIGLSSLIPSATKTHINLEFDHEQLLANISTEVNEYSAANHRKSIGNSTEKLSKYLEKNNYKVDTGNIEISNPINPDEPYTFEFKFQTKPELINEKIYISPFCNETMEENPLQQPERNYPVDMVYPTKTTILSHIIIPDGYDVDYTAENLKIDNDLFEMEYNISLQESSVEIQLYYYFRKSIYSVEDYSKIKYYFNELVKKGNEKVVFKKITSEP
ncbi:DUF3857 domain-containing protein [uncultured Draconibacterium sp.]|uniref:DUF3857 domain-containing protein n=1 Tax=uncultured Draconibacterium sp. TaxID=1573823 RepID=UPI003217C5F0